MSNQRRKNQKNHIHDWVKEERKLDDGFAYYYYICKKCHEVRYPSEQLQRLFEYRKEHVFLSPREVALILLYAGESIYEKHSMRNYISGITFFQKLVFLFYMELANEYSIPVENPGFFAYKYGPYSDDVDDIIQILLDSETIETKGGMKSSKKERFYLTDKGKEKAKKIINKLDRRQKNAIIEFRRFWDQKKLVGLVKYVYSKYPSYTNKSVILNDLFPGRKLNRRRG